MKYKNSVKALTCFKNVKGTTLDGFHTNKSNSFNKKIIACEAAIIHHHMLVVTVLTSSLVRPRMLESLAGCLTELCASDFY